MSLTSMKLTRTCLISYWLVLAFNHEMSVAKFENLPKTEVAKAKSATNLTRVLRAAASTHSAARPWPRPSKSMKRSQRLSSTWKRTSSKCSVMKDARHVGLGGSSSKVFGLKGTSVCVKSHVRRT